MDDGQAWQVLDLAEMCESRLQDWSPDARCIGFTEEIGRKELWVDRDLLEERSSRDAACPSGLLRGEFGRSLVGLAGEQ